MACARATWWAPSPTRPASGGAIGAIDLYDRFAFVEVASVEAENVLRALERTTIRGRRVKARVAIPER